MRNLLSWLVTGLILTTASAYVLRPLAADRRTAPVVEAFALESARVVAPDYVEPQPPAIDSRRWCEPVDLQPCEPGSGESQCSPTADGTPRTCVPERWVPGSTEHVCRARKPTR